MSYIMTLSLLQPKQAVVLHCRPCWHCSRSMQSRWVCCWAPCRHEMSVNSGGRQVPSSNGTAAWRSAANVSWAVLLTTKVRTRLNTDLFIDDLVLVYRRVWSAKWTAFVLCLLCITRSCQKCVLYLKPWQRLVDLFNIELCSVWRL